jgi:predicted nucleic acid-binding Zn ribbon protein
MTTEENDENPMHKCLVCDKFIGMRGFCSDKCYNEYYRRMVEF